MEFGTNAHNLAPLKDTESEPYFTDFTFLVQRMDELLKYKEYFSRQKYIL